MKTVYCGGQFRFDCADGDYLRKAALDYRASLLGDVNRLLNGKGLTALSGHTAYIGPYYFETAGMLDRDIVKTEMRMIGQCTHAYFLLEDASCPGTVSELIYAATLRKKICIAYVRDENETESALRSPCWYPIIQSGLISRSEVTVIACGTPEQAGETLLNEIRK